MDTLSVRFGTGRCVIIGEVAQAHDGSLGMAHAFIDAIASAGADAVKFQTHIAAAESTSEETWRVKFSQQDASRYDYWKRMEFSEEQWAGLRRHAAERGLWFVCSPFSLEAVELLMRVEPDAWKIASGEISSFHALDRMLSTKLPVLVSTGMSRLSEVDAAVRRVTATACPLAVLQCTTAYPCPPEKVGLNMIPLYRERYGCAVGLSDHSGTVFPGLAAATIGVDVLELHVTMSREMFGPDVPASVTTTEFRQLVDGVRYIEKMTANPVDKDALAGEADSLRTVFTKSIVTRVALPAGTRLEEHHLAFRKPGTGIPESMMQQVLSRRLKRALPANTILREDYLE